MFHGVTKNVSRERQRKRWKPSQWLWKPILNSLRKITRGTQVKRDGLAITVERRGISSGIALRHLSRPQLHVWSSRDHIGGDTAPHTESEAGGQASLISWHSYIGIPINFNEESGIVSFWSNELSAPWCVKSMWVPLSRRSGELWLSLESPQGTLQGNPAFLWVRASRGPFQLSQKTQSPSHIPISEGRLLLRWLWKVGSPLQSMFGQRGPGVCMRWNDDRRQLRLWQHCRTDPSKVGRACDREAWWATVRRVAKSQTWLKRHSTHTGTHARPHLVMWSEPLVFSCSMRVRITIQRAGESLHRQYDA